MHAAHDLLGALLAVSASADVASRRIPNLLPASIAAAGVAHAISQRGILAALGDVAVGLLVAAILVLLWRAGLLGGGDVKLAVACALWVGAGRLAAFAVATAVSGGLVALWSVALALRSPVAAVARATAAAGGAMDARERAAVRTIPYGVAIASGALFALRG